MKLFHKIYVIAFMAVFVCGGALVLFLGQNDYSKNENRYLEKLPSFSWDTYRKGEYQDKLEKALTDQFPMRDVLTGLSTMYRKVAGLHDVGDVYLGKDHFYLDKKLEKDVSASQFGKNLASVKKFSDTYCPDLKLMLVPSPATVMEDKLPSFAKIYDESPYVKTAVEMFGERFIDVRGEFERQGYSDSIGFDECTEVLGGSNDRKDDGNLFFRTDHHWTHRGAFAGFCAYKGLDPGFMSRHYTYRVVSEDFLGTMYSRALDNGAVADTIAIPDVPEGLVVKAGEKEMPFYAMDKLKEKDQYAVYLGGNYPEVTITNPNLSALGDENQGKKLLIFKDSFANSLVPLLTWEYDEITMIDLRYEIRPMSMLMKQYQPDDVLVLYEFTTFAQSTEVARLGI